MGKSEVARLPVTRQARLNLLIPEKQVVEKMTLEVPRKKSGEFPPDVEVLNNQVAGHMDDGKALGEFFISRRFSAWLTWWKEGDGYLSSSI